jgi:WD40 repeat protein
LLTAGSGPTGKTGEALCCAYTPDGAFLLSGGWDGQLRLWESAFGSHVSAFQVSDKPVSACTVSPDGKNLLSGSLDGLLAVWDALTHQPKVNFLAHTRPISAMTYSADGQTLATASWDNTVNIWLSLRRHDARTLAGHRDIVAGCQFTPDGQSLLSWSYDMMVYLWNVARAQPQRELGGHADRVLAGAISSDGQFAATGARDGDLKLWDLQKGIELATARLRGEVHGCLFLLDGRSLVAVDHHGRLTLHSLPSLGVQGEIISRAAVQACDLSPSGAQLALACSDGWVHFIAIDGFDSAPLLVGTSKTSRKVASTLQKLFGKFQVIDTYHCTCPVCRHQFEVPHSTAGVEVNCTKCRRKLRLSGVQRVAPEKKSD